jgi:hypothetical protein
VTKPLGDSGLVEGAADPNNLYVPGAYTVTVGPQQIGVSNGVGNFECYHIAIQGPPGSSFQVWISGKFYDFVQNGDINSWDPAQPMKLISGNTVYFYWNVATGEPVPAVTMYFQEANPI